MKIIIILIFFSLLSSALYAQGPYSIKGSVEDTIARTKIQDGAVSILNAKDSILVKFIWTAPDGSFSINNVPKGSFILLVTYPAYADYVQQFSLDSVTQMHDFGRLYLTTKARLLAEVIIRGRAAIVIKGDTTEFNAEKFVIQPNSKVEDLLVQLPGIQVDENGKITAHGKPVAKVLVDGEEFFGDDPTLVTRNIRGDMVDKIQLYDDKTPQAKLTGIDDGKKVTTMNVVLKEDKKNGYFGKLDGGIATNNLYQEQGMFNAFKTKSKASVYGTAGSTGKIGLGSADGDRLGASAFLAAGVSTGVRDEFETFNGTYEGRGIPTALSTGAHYDGKWNNDKKSININFKAGSLDIEGSTSTLRMDPLLSNPVTTNFNQVTDNSLFRQRIDGVYQAQLNASSTLRVSAEGTLRNTETRLNESSSSTRSNNMDFYRNTRDLSSDGDQKLMNFSISLNKKLKKPKRTFTAGFSTSYNEEDKKGFVNSVIRFYNTAGIADSTKHVDQYKTSTGRISAVSGNLSWGEPISKTWTGSFSYRTSINSNSLDRRSFNSSVPGKYDIVDKEFSNDLKSDILTNTGAVYFNYTKSKANIYLGTNVSAVKNLQTDAFNGTNYERNFINLNPEARYSLAISQQKSMTLQYQGSTTQPTISQMQPLKVNDDPLNITLGNPDLKPSFNSYFSLYFNSFKVLTSRSVNFSSTVSFTSNQIALNSTTDLAGKRTFQSVNITGKKPLNFSLSSSFSRKLKSDLQLGVSYNLYANSSFNFINSSINKVRNLSFIPSFSVSKSKLKKYNYSLSVSPRYMATSHSLLKDFDDKRWVFFSSASFTAYLPGKVEISSNARYVYTESTQSFSQPATFILNSTISKKFLKSEGLKFSVTGNDLLKQNIGFSRTDFTQTSYITIPRYFMGSLSWDFSKMGAAKPKN